MQETVVTRLVISEEDAAASLGVAPRTLQRWRVTGEGPAFCKLGSRIGYRREDLESFVAAARRTSTSGRPRRPTGGASPRRTTGERRK